MFVRRFTRSCLFRAPHSSTYNCEELAYVPEKDYGVFGRKQGVREVYLLFDTRMTVAAMQGA
jgi:hypothetical protein